MINLLALDSDSTLCAQAHTDEDLMLMPSVYADTLTLAHIGRGSGVMPRHVVAKWAMGNLGFFWMSRLLKAMLAEQAYRFGEEDWDARQTLLDIYYDADIPNTVAPKRFLQLLPDKQLGNAVEAYRAWYHKEANPCWTRRGPPDWWQGSIQTTLF